MKAKELLELAGDPRFISGIYNYCDRWCERCQFASRCLVFATEQADADDPAAHDITNEAFWQKLRSIFQQTHEMLVELAAEQGIDLESVDSESAMKAKRRRRKRADDHELVRAGESYIKMVNEWFAQKAPECERATGQSDDQVSLQIEEYQAHERGGSLDDAIAIVRWYQFQIAVKLMRGFTGRDSEEPGEEGTGALKIDRF